MSRTEAFRQGRSDIEGSADEHNKAGVAQDRTESPDPITLEAATTTHEANLCSLASYILDD
jgi:hypothetical protein